MIDHMLNQAMEICGIPDDEFDDPDRFVWDRSVLTHDTWVTKDGVRLPVETMGDQHLLNCIKMLRRMVELWRMQEIWSIGNYIENAPDHAADAASDEADRMVGMDEDQFLSRHIACYPLMLQVVNRRGLELPPPEASKL